MSNKNKYLKSVLYKVFLINDINSIILLHYIIPLIRFNKVLHE